MLLCVFSDSKFHYYELSRMTSKLQVTLSCPKMTQEILLQSETNDAKNGATSLYAIWPLLFLHSFHSMLLDDKVVLTLVSVSELLHRRAFICRLSREVHQLTPFDNSLYGCFR